MSARKPFKSCAKWPKGCFDGEGNYSDDGHDMESQARAVCLMLRRDGAGGLGQQFPVETWIEKLGEDGTYQRMA